MPPRNWHCCDLLSFIVSLLIGNSNPSEQDSGTPESDITSGKSEGTGKEPGHDRKENFSKSIPNTYLDVLQYLQEAAYFMADFYVALSPSEIDDDSEILEKSL